MGGLPRWVDTMADDVALAAGGLSDVSRYTVRVHNGAGGGAIVAESPTRDSNSPAWGAARTGEAVVKVDWTDLDGGITAGTSVSTGEVAQAVASFVLNGSIDGLRPAEAPIHLIGHSRGGSLMAAVARILGEHGVWVDHVTTLDPHPVDGVNEPPIDVTSGGNLVYPNFGDAPLTLKDNVVFADNYWRTDWNDGVYYDPGATATRDFDGEPVSGSVNVQLAENTLTGTGYSTEHSDVHLWYQGTIGPRPVPFTQWPNSDGDASVAVGWYGGQHPPRDATGFRYTRILGGSRPRNGLSQGFGGDVARPASSRSGTQRPNIGQLTLSESGSRFEIGQTLHANFKHQDYDGASDVQFFLDRDRNPYNNNNAAGDPSHPMPIDPTARGFVHLGTRSTTIGAGSAEIFTGGQVQPDTAYYVYAKIQDGAFARYAYYPLPIQFSPPPADSTPPTANLADPTNGGSISQATLNSRGWLQVTFSDTGGGGLNGSTITDGDDEFSIAGIDINGAATPVAGGAPNTYRYAFTGSFQTGPVTVSFIAGRWADSAATPNTNSSETERFTVAGAQVPPDIEILGNGTPIPYQDETPDTGDGTHFGAADVSGQSVTRTFSIRNNGSQTLNLTGTTAPVQVLVGNTSDFAVVQQPSTSIAPNNSSDFQVRFDPTALGTRSALLVVYNNDPDEGNYSFRVAGSGEDEQPPPPPTGEPEVTVRYDSVNLTDGQSSPVDFGTDDEDSAKRTKDFTIRNDGDRDLTIYGVTVTGDFSLTESPGTTVRPGGYTNFTIEMENNSSGTKQGGVRISTNDGDESVFNFPLSGSVVSNVPEISVADTTVLEGNFGTEEAIFTVSIPDFIDGSWGAAYTLSSGTATAGQDYQSVSGSFSVNGSLSKTHQIDVDVLGDVAVEGNETFSLTLHSPEGAVLGDRQATATIIDNDTAGANSPRHAWSTYLGGDFVDSAADVATDSGGSVYVVGSTYPIRDNWVSGGYDTTHNGAESGFLAKFGPAGDHLWSTYWDNRPQLNSVTTDAAGNVYAATFGELLAFRSDGALLWAAQDERISGRELFVVGDEIFTTASQGVITFGTNGQFRGYTEVTPAGVSVATVARATDGSLYVGASTRVTGLGSGGHDTSHNGRNDAYLVKLDPSGSQAWSTYLGGVWHESVEGLVINENGDLVLVGETSTADWANTSSSVPIGHDAPFVAKFSPVGQLMWLRRYDGTGEASPRDAMLSGSGSVLVSGSAVLSAWASVPFDNTPHGDQDSFIFEIDGNGQAIWGTFLGANGSDSGSGFGVAPDGDVLIAGRTDGGWIAGGWDSVLGGSGDGYLARIDMPALPKPFGTVRGTNGPDTYHARLNPGGTSVQIFENSLPTGVPTYELQVTGLPPAGLTFETLGGDDVLTLASANLPPTRFNGGNGIDTLGVDAGVFTLGRDRLSETEQIAIRGGVFTGAGTVPGGVTATGGSVRPGLSPGLLTVNGTYAQSSTGRLDVELNGPVAGTGYDRLAVNGPVALGGTLAVSLGYAPAPGQAFVVVDNDGTDPVAGTFAGLPEGAVVTAGGWRLRVGYAGGSGNDVTLTAIGAAVTGRHVFYNRSAYDGTTGSMADGPADAAAIATDKAALLPLGVATSANYTNYSRGINGVMIDVAGLAAGGASLLPADLLFRAGPGGNPSTWTTAPAPAMAVRPGAGIDGSDRIVLTWADGAIKNTWLQVTVPAGAKTGLAAADVFYFGNAVGDTMNSASTFRVDSQDVTRTRNAQMRPTTIQSQFDHNRDGRVNTQDQVVARNSQGFTLTRITAPAAVTAAESVSGPGATPTGGAAPNGGPPSAGPPPKDKAAGRRRPMTTSILRQGNV